MRQECAVKQEKANKQMIGRHKSSNPCATYNLGDTVFVKRIYAKNKKGKRVVHKGTIIDKKNQKYHVKFTKDGHNQTEWFTANQITAETRAEENKKHGKEKYFKSDYHLIIDESNGVNQNHSHNHNIPNHDENHKCQDQNQNHKKETVNTVTRSYNLRTHRKRIFVENSDFDLKRALEESRKEVRIR